MTAGLLAGAAFVSLWGWADFGGETLGLWVSDAGSALVNAAAAAVILTVAFGYARGEAVRRRWLLVGLGVSAFAIGDVIWTVLEAGMGLSPWPSLADIFYLSEYGFLFAAILGAGLAYRSFVDVRGLVLISSAVGIALVSVGLASFTRPYVWADAELGLAAKALATAYPVLDAALLVVPAVFVALVIRNLGTGRLAWPWWAMVLAAILLGTADTAYYALDATGIAIPDAAWSLIDSGWMGAHAVMAFAAMLARDVERV